MATTRTAKVQGEIDKAKAKLAEQQAKIRDLEQKRTEIENTEIVDIVRGMSIPLEDLAMLLQSIKNSGAIPVPAPTSTPNAPKSEGEINEDSDNNEEDSDE